MPIQIYMNAIQAEIKKLEDLNLETVKLSCFGSERKPVYNMLDAMELLNVEFYRYTITKTKRGKYLLDGFYEDQNGNLSHVGTNEEDTLEIAVCVATIHKYKGTKS